MNISYRFNEISEPYAAGFFEDETRSLFYRFSKAHYRFMEHCPLPKFNGGELYPCGAMAADYNKIYAIYPQFSRTYEVDYDFFDKKDKELSRFCLENMPQRERFNLDKKLFYGTAYAHGTPNFSRILKEGLNSYRQRIENCKDADFREGCLLIIASMELFKNRCVEYLKTTSCPEKLIKALSKVPFEPAESFYEAVVAYGFIYYMDLCDNLGQLEKTLLPYYKGEDAYPLLRELFLNVEASSGWDIQMGPQKTPLSISILRAARGLCRPQVQLFISKDTSPELFDGIGFSDIAAISPGVLSQTGIETAEIVKSVSKKLSQSTTTANIIAEAARHFIKYTKSPFEIFPVFFESAAKSTTAPTIDETEYESGIPYAPINFISIWLRIIFKTITIKPFKAGINVFLMA
jgi:hypothetical protein